MKKIIKLTESDLISIIKRVVHEQIKPVSSSSMVDPLNGAQLMSVTKSNDAKSSSATIAPSPIGQKPKINFMACSSSSYINCFETPDSITPGTYSFSDQPNPYQNFNFFFWSKDQKKYQCTFSSPCKKI